MNTPKAEKQPVHATGALADDFYAVLVMALANRLHQGASNYYLRYLNIGLTEYRLLLALGKNNGVNVGQVAATADLDKAAASRGLKNLEQNGLVSIEQTRQRGRAAIVTLTSAGTGLQKKLKVASQRRDKRFVKGFSAAELAQFKEMIHRLMGNVEYMNQE
ncbi:MAG: transcriptional regulator, MarR family [Burkholderia sp.]|nr:transcriptional regulator, MarR family [Burkholderia sp.]